MWNQLKKIANDDGIKVYRGVSDKPSDAGDLGIGEYWTIYKSTAKQYGQDVKEQIINLQNPMIVTVDEARKLIEEYGTVRGKLEDRKLGAIRLTRDLKEQGYDGLIVDGYETPAGYKTVVDFRNVESA